MPRPAAIARYDSVTGEPRRRFGLGMWSAAPRGAKRARVTYTVSARDEVDGSVPVSCQPRPGSRFRIGRTAVNCSAIDGSGNTATARFTITVKRRR